MKIALSKWHGALLLVPLFILAGWQVTSGHAQGDTLGTIASNDMRGIYVHGTPHTDELPKANGELEKHESPTRKIHAINPTC